MPRSDPAIARQHRDWLRALPQQTGKALTTLAKELKIAPSTLTRPLKEGDDGTSTLHANTIAKVVEHTGVAGPTEVGSPSTGRRAPTRALSEEATPFEPGPQDPLREAVKALSGGRKATSWTVHNRALDLVGVLPGDVVIVDLGATAQPGDFVCAQTIDVTTGKRATVIREFQRAGATDILVSRSSDPALHSMLPVDGERVIIKGVLLPHRLRP
jgi:hypothetical protein